MTKHWLQLQENENEEWRPLQPAKKESFLSRKLKRVELGFMLLPVPMVIFLVLLVIKSILALIVEEHAQENSSNTRENILTAVGTVETLSALFYTALTMIVGLYSFSLAVVQKQPGEKKYTSTNEDDKGFLTRCHKPQLSSYGKFVSSVENASVDARVLGAFAASLSAVTTFQLALNRFTVFDDKSPVTFKLLIAAVSGGSMIASGLANFYSRQTLLGNPTHGFRRQHEDESNDVAMHGVVSANLRNF